ncbi:collagen-like triple helix repeat-containing protein, partial [Bacillus thuringiensis]
MIYIQDNNEIRKKEIMSMALDIIFPYRLTGPTGNTGSTGSTGPTGSTG